MKQKLDESELTASYLITEMKQKMHESELAKLVEINLREKMESAKQKELTEVLLYFKIYNLQ